MYHSDTQDNCTHRNVIEIIKWPVSVRTPEEHFPTSYHVEWESQHPTTLSGIITYSHLALHKLCTTFISGCIYILLRTESQLWVFQTILSILNLHIAHLCTENDGKMGNMSMLLSRISGNLHIKAKTGGWVPLRKVLMIRYAICPINPLIKFQFSKFSCIPDCKC